MYLAHLPLNHHLRPLYRLLAGLAGVYLAVFGGMGVVAASGLDLFARQNLPEVFGQPVNPAQAGMLLVFGIIITLAVVIGRNVDHYVNFWTGQLLLLIGLLMLTVERTDANILAYAVPNVVVTWTAGLLVLAGSLYGKIGPQKSATVDRTDTRDVQHPRMG